MSLSLACHQFGNGIRNNRAEIASGLILFPVYAGAFALGIAAALMGVNIELSGFGSCCPLLKTKNKCATSAKVIKAIEQPTEKNVSKAFSSQVNKIHQLDLNDKRIPKYEKRLSDIYSSYIKSEFPKYKDIEPKILFSISSHGNVLKASINEDIDREVVDKIKRKIKDHNSVLDGNNQGERIKLTFEF